ncbi:MAG: radical SAM protein [Syntrophobacterales bacterium]|jgi:radical SAM protein with 4Fe4S-binding SPASM domain
METVTYEDFALGISHRISGKRIPLRGTIEVTRRCPLTCAHCYNNLAIQDEQARLTELSYEEHCRILDEIVEAGCFWLLYTGGEIFVRPDFLDIYKYAKQQGLLITLFTNAVLINKKIADSLAEYPPHFIEITLYGHTKKTYEKITGKPGSFDRCIRGIHLLMERGLPLKLKTMVITLNKHEISDMKRFVEEDLGLEFRYDAMINPRIDGSQNPLALRLTPDEVVELDVQDPERLAEWDRFCEHHVGPRLDPKQSHDLYQCGGGIGSFAIDPAGKMSLCAMSASDTYDLRQGSFREGWEDFISTVRQKKITRRTKCFSCEIKSMCGMCPANGELEKGDPEEPVDFLCRVAHLRAHELGLTVPPHGDCEYCKTPL